MQTPLSLDLDFLLENVPFGAYCTDTERKITFWNTTAEKITGYKAGEVLGKSCADNILNHVDSAGNNLCTSVCPLSKSLTENQSQQADVFLHHKKGFRVPVSVTVIPLCGANGKLTGGIEFFSDLTVMSALQQRVCELEKLALMDKLTNLSNRHHTMPALEAVFKERDFYGLSFGILMMDLDNFKSINDKLGHDVGDNVLEMVASTLQNGMRPYDHLGRWGGEEFIGIIRNADSAALQILANRFRSLVEASFLMVEDTPLHVTISIGATMGGKEDTPETIVKRADQLLYESKKNGKNRVTCG